MRGTLAERFWAKVDKRGPDECWEWRGAKSNGYGLIGEGGRTSGAHRVSWELANGAIPASVCHTCDNRGCVNPAHLFLCTHVGNMRDMVNKSRAARGDRVGSSELTEQDVHEIRQMLSCGVLQRVIAAKYAIAQQSISDINTGKQWGWLKEE